jgi:hypothetical protein
MRRGLRILVFCVSKTGLWVKGVGLGRFEGEGKWGKGRYRDRNRLLDTFCCLLRRRLCPVESELVYSFG